MNSSRIIKPETRPGVIKVIHKKDRPYYDAIEIQELLGVGKSKAYEMIRRMRRQLISEGKISPEYPCGKIPKKYFDNQCGI